MQVNKIDEKMIEFIDGNNAYLVKIDELRKFLFEENEISCPMCLEPMQLKKSDDGKWKLMCENTLCGIEITDESKEKLYKKHKDYYNTFKWIFSNFKTDYDGDFVYWLWRKRDELVKLYKSKQTIE